MAHSQKKAKSRSRSTALQRAILSAARSVQHLTTLALSGNLNRMYKLVDASDRKRKYHSMLVARDRLIRNGLLRRNGRFTELTEKGAQRLKQWECSEYRILTPKQWDEKWRILIFDIPEKKKDLRNKLRATLRAIGFKRLQHSVWIHPFDCEDLIALLKADFQVGKNLLYITAEAVEGDAHLRDFFGVYPA